MDAKVNLETKREEVPGTARQVINLFSSLFLLFLLSSKLQTYL
tara:strand:- start:197 stop:325 length:129 start_codon:yes stop_codon:yes gene_type:complete